MYKKQHTTKPSGPLTGYIYNNSGYNPPSGFFGGTYIQNFWTITYNSVCWLSGGDVCEKGGS